MAWSYNWMPVVAVWMRDNDLGENTCHYLDPAARLPGAEAFVHIATGFTAFERGDRGEAQRSVDRALAVRPDLTRKIIRQAFRFPKWLALAVGVGPQPDMMLEMGLPAE